VRWSGWLPFALIGVVVAGDGGGSRRHGWEGVYEGSWSWVGVGTCWCDDDATVYTSIKYAKTLEDGLPPMPSWVAHSTFRHYRLHPISYSIVDRLMEMLDSNSVDVLQSKRTLPWLRLVEAPMQWREECSTRCKRIAISQARTSRQVEHSLRHSWKTWWCSVMILVDHGVITRDDHVTTAHNHSKCWRQEQHI
jgi:hypothetical protein